MSFENCGDMVLDEELVDGQVPAGPVGFEAVGAVEVFAAPFVEGRDSTPPREAASAVRRLWMKTNLNLAVESARV